MFLRRLHVKYFSTRALIIGSKAKPINIPKISLPEFLWSRQEKCFDKTAIVCVETERSYTYHQLYKRTLSFSAFLKNNLKLNLQDTVALVLNNVPEYPIVFLGTIQAGLKVTTCNTNYTAAEIKRQLDDSNTRVVVTSTDLLPIVKLAAPDIPIIEISNTNSFSNNCISFEEISTKDSGIPIYNNNVDDTVALPYSSGTTGLPKGVELTHSNIVSSLCQCLSPEFQYTHQHEEKQNVIPAIVPFFHVFGMFIVMAQALAQGSKMLSVPKFTNNHYINILKKYKPEVIHGPPLLVLLSINNPNVKKEDLTCLRFLVSGAASLTSTDVDRFLSKTDNKVNLIQGYGMTETTSAAILQTKTFNNGIKLGGCGFLLPQTEARVISVETGVNLGPNQSGELLIRGPQVMKGYHLNPKATEDTFLGGWLKTGDIAYYDEDEHFFITDRLKELIKVKGFQVAPAELESVLREHPCVEEAAIVGVPHNDLGEAPKAFIVVKKESHVGSQELQEFVAARLAKHKHLKGGVVFVDVIPKTPSGKILRKELQKM